MSWTPAIYSKLQSASRRSVLFITLSATLAVAAPPPAAAQKPSRAHAPAANHSASARPKLVVVLVVDQMRGDYVDKFRGQWTGGLKRLLQEGAWFRSAAYPYGSTETCVGHATISTGAFPRSHGLVSNEWWDRELQKNITCTADASIKNISYGGTAVTGGDSAAKMLLPAFAEELRIQQSAGSKVVTFSLKARAAITLAGRRADAVTWFDGAAGAWVTSTAYQQAAFVGEFAKAHPVTGDYGKTWTPFLPESQYFYDRTALGAVGPPEYGAAFPHTLGGKKDSHAPDSVFYSQWATSPFAETYLAQMAEDAVDKLHLGQGPSTDFLGISFSSVDYVGHAFGPRSWEIQDELARLDQDLAAFFAHLDKSIGRGNYLVALSAYHGVTPIPEELLQSGADAGWLSLQEVKTRIGKVLEKSNYAKPADTAIAGSDIYFSPGTYEKLKLDGKTLQAVVEAIQSVPGVAHVYQAEDLDDQSPAQNSMRYAEASGFFKPRSGDLIIVPKPYWPWDFSATGTGRLYGTTHGTPYYYDQHVPILFMGWGIQPGEYFAPVTPADIAPTLAQLCGITLASRDGRALSEAFATHRTMYKQTTSNVGCSAKP